MNANEPAYPFYAPSVGSASGLTKRELIAAMCLQGLLSHCGNSTVTTWAASHAIDFADALLTELAKEQT